ncbi:MAG TPA: hypothetical protein DEP05_00545, partial [Betaproteobacteria bacterium]|nr:hypothetical protein [Betaproteobacteria bacterium]
PPPAAAIGHPEESCLFDARQRKIIGPIALYPLPNGDILASLATVQVRLDAATGMPAQVISPGETPNPDITVSTVCVDSAANYLALRAALRARLRRDDWTRYLRRLDAAAARKLVYWLMMQYFMFPNQLIPR